MPTYIKGFDKLIEGGLPKGSITLISGAPGTGKSIFCMQALYNNALKGRNCLFITFEQTPDKIKQQMLQFGMSFNKVDGKLNIVAFDSDDPDILDKIWAEARKGKYVLLALDSLASLAGSPVPEEQLSSYTMEQVFKSIVPVPMQEENVTRMKIKMLLNYLQKSGATVLVTSEIIEGTPGMSRDTISEFLCDGIVKLTHTDIGGRKVRLIEVLKMRETKIDDSQYGLIFAKNGLKLAEEIER